jgi:hypothetical protein
MRGQAHLGGAYRPDVKVLQRGEARQPFVVALHRWQVDARSHRGEKITRLSGKRPQVLLPFPAKMHRLPLSATIRPCTAHNVLSVRENGFSGPLCFQFTLSLKPELDLVAVRPLATLP